MIIMAEKQKLRAPTGMAGLVKYEDEGESLIKLKPVHVVGISVGLIILEVILFLMIPL
jgi:preprotein translocase subunit Sec61beta